MPSPTGVWSQEEAATGHIFDYKLAKWIGELFRKDEQVVDMGCGPATYLRYFHDIGFEFLQGFEGTYIPGSEFSNVMVQDLTEPFQYPSIGNVICLEVAEHIPEEFMDQFLKNITNHVNGYLILSWGIPGQGGLGHVNCRHNIWVVDHICKKYNMVFDAEKSLQARENVSNHAHWFRDTLMVFRNR